jgi:hypothetical protein
MVTTPPERRHPNPSAVVIGRLVVVLGAVILLLCVAALVAVQTEGSTVRDDLEKAGTAFTGSTVVRAEQGQQFQVYRHGDAAAGLCAVEGADGDLPVIDRAQDVTRLPDTDRESVIAFAAPIAQEYTVACADGAELMIGPRIADEWIDKAALLHRFGLPAALFGAFIAFGGVATWLTGNGVFRPGTYVPGA